MAGVYGGDPIPGSGVALSIEYIPPVRWPHFTILPPARIMSLTICEMYSMVLRGAGDVSNCSGGPQISNFSFDTIFRTLVSYGLKVV